MARVVAYEEAERRSLARAAAAPPGWRRRYHERRAQSARRAWCELYARVLTGRRSPLQVSIPVREVGDR
jgi:hypothetical protein